MLRFIKRLKFNAPITLSFVFISFIVYIIAAFSGGLSNALLFSVYRSVWNDLFAYIRIFTHILGHASMEHYFSNMMLILLLGPIVEERYGSKQLLLIIVITGLVTGLINIIFFPYAILLGASGIVFMLIILSSIVNYEKGRIPITFVLVVAIYLGREVYFSIAIEDNVSRITHVAGGICGAAMGFYIKGKTRKEKTDIISP